MVYTIYPFKILSSFDPEMLSDNDQLRVSCELHESISILVHCINLLQYSSYCNVPFFFQITQNNF